MLSHARSRRKSMKHQDRRVHRLHHPVQEVQASRSREDLLEFVRQRREEKVRALLELDRDEREGKTSEERFRIRPVTPEVHLEIPSLVQAREKSARLTRERGGGVCPDCGLGAADGWPCRVCGRPFHRPCLLRTANLREDDLDDQLARAHTNIGWSCPSCDDISKLLTEKELTDMMEDFEHYDINKEAGITLEDYVAIKKHEYASQEGHQMGDLDLLRVKAQFQCMDINGDGQVDWWEFVKQETCKKLAKRSKDELVSLLTDQEVSTAHQLFIVFDDDEDGRISDYTVRKAYRSWYGRLTRSAPTTAKTRSSLSLARADTDAFDDPELNLHVEHHCRIVLGESEDHRCGNMDQWIQKIALPAVLLLAILAVYCSTTDVSCWTPAFFTPTHTSHAIQQCSGNGSKKHTIIPIGTENATVEEWAGVVRVESGHLQKLLLGELILVGAVYCILRWLMVAGSLDARSPANLHTAHVKVPLYLLVQISACLCWIVFAINTKSDEDWSGDDSTFSCTFSVKQLGNVNEHSVQCREAGEEVLRVALRGNFGLCLVMAALKLIHLLMVLVVQPLLAMNALGAFMAEKKMNICSFALSDLYFAILVSPQDTPTLLQRSKSEKENEPHLYPTPM